MAAVDRIVRIIIAGDSRGGVRAMRETSAAAEKTTAKIAATGTAAEEAEVKLDAMAGGARRLRSSVMTLAGTLGLAGLGFGIAGAIHLGIQWQNQQAQLQSALKATGNVGGAALKEINAQLEEQATKGGFAPTVEISGVNRFITQLGSVKAALRSNNAVVALARRTGMDYEAALSLVSGAQAGQARGLQKYIGIVIPVTSHVRALSAVQRKLHPELLQTAKVLDKQATAQIVNERLMRRMGRATEDFSKTTAGKISNAENRFEALKVQLGQKLLPVVLAVLKAILAIVNVFQRHKGATTAFAAGLAVLTAGFVALKVATIEWGEALALTPMGALIIAFSALVAVLIYAHKHSEQFRTGMHRIFGWIGNAAHNAVNAIEAAWKPLKEILMAPFKGLLWIIHQAIKAFRFVTGLPGKAFHFVGSLAGGLGLNQGGLVPGFAGGGFVGGTGPNRDSLLAGLTPGEFVMRRSAVQSVGAGTLDAINETGRVPASSDGGTLHVTLPVTVKIDARAIAEETHKYTLRRQSFK